MTAPEQVEQQPTNKELNFRALEAKYQRELERLNSEKERLSQQLEERNKVQEEPESTDPYIDHKRLDKKFNQFSQSTQTEIQKAMAMAKEAAKDELKQEMFLDNNPDFYDVLKNVEKFAQKVPKLAETILKMPEGFERQKLVYQSIKELGLDKPEVKQQSIQEKVDANKRSPYYQPSGVGTAPYAQGGDFSPTGQKAAHAKMKELQARLRI
jgi:heme oxygenase